MDDKPEEGDYAIRPTGYLGSMYELTEIGRQSLGVFRTLDRAMKFARERMEQENFWPNVWSVSDHGNWHLLER